MVIQLTTVISIWARVTTYCTRMLDIAQAVTVIIKIILLMETATVIMANIQTPAMDIVMIMDKQGTGTVTRWTGIWRLKLYNLRVLENKIISDDIHISFKI